MAVEDTPDSWYCTEFGQYTKPMKARKFNPDGTQHGQGSWFKVADSANRGANAQKVPGFNFHQFEEAGKPGGSFQSASVKGLGGMWFHGNEKNPARGDNEWETSGVKQPGLAGEASRSVARKAASAEIAKIPMPLSEYIARCFKCS